MIEEKLKLREGIELRVLGEEALFYDQNENMVHVLNQSAAYIIDLCKEEAKVSDIIDFFAKKYSIAAEEAKEDVENAIKEFKRLNIFEGGE